MKSNKPSEKKLENHSIIHLYLYENLRKNFKVGQHIPYKYLVFRLKQIIYHVPRKYYDIVIRELIDLKLLETIHGGRSPIYKLNEKDYNILIEDLKELDKSTQRFKMLNSRYKKILDIIEKEEKFDQKYKLLKCDYEKLLKKLELKKLEGSHYW